MVVNRPQALLRYTSITPMFTLVLWAIIVCVTLNMQSFYHEQAARKLAQPLLHDIPFRHRLLNESIGPLSTQ